MNIKLTQEQIDLIYGIFDMEEKGDGYTYYTCNLILREKDGSWELDNRIIDA